jgi:nanoRNase/pAp phosphatase (c-di-AMP/oligoRNAs hydrolase)
MIALEQLTSLKDYLATAQSIAVIVGPKPTADQLSVASALYQGLVALGKEVGIYSPKNLEGRQFSASKNLSTELGKQNLVVEFDYDENAVDKVSYHIGEASRKFYLTIKPKKGQAPLKAEAVKFSYAGADADLVFLVGVHDLETLDQLYFGYENLYTNAFVVTLHTFKPELGNVQLDLSGVSSMSEAVFDILAGLELPVNVEAATDLLRGIESMTNNLQSLSVSAETFEVVARLLRAGARRTAKPADQSTRPQAPTRPFESGRKLTEVERPVVKTFEKHPKNQPAKKHVLAGRRYKLKRSGRTGR